MDGSGWLSEGWYGLDQGLLAMMIENHRSGLIWEIFRQSPYVRAGLAGRLRRRMAAAMTDDADAPGKAKPGDDVFLRRVRPGLWKNPEPRAVYDLAIVGAGPAGIAAAECAARLGARVALVERNRLGGNSLNAGSVPSKAIIQTARVYASLRAAEEFGAPLPAYSGLDFGKVMERMRRVRTRIAEHHSVEKLTALGIDVFFGTARFDGADALLAGDTPLQYRKALLATGARPKLPAKIPGLDATAITPAQHLRPGRAAQAVGRHRRRAAGLRTGAGILPTGVAGDHRAERAEIPAARGTRRRRNPVPRHGAGRRGNPAEHHGRGRAQDRRRKNPRHGQQRNEVRFEADEILLSIGRVPNVDGLGLEAAGIELNDEQGVKIDDFLRTTNPDVYAAGDVCMTLKFTNAAQASAKAAVRNALSGGQERQSELNIPWCTYCDPEIAHIGMHVWQARQQSMPIKSYTVMMHDVDRAIAGGLHEGFVKIHVAEGTDRILGATIVASRASELVNEMSVIMSAGMGMNDLAGVIHTYPAESGAIMLAALAYVRSQHLQQS